MHRTWLGWACSATAGDFLEAYEFTVSGLPYRVPEDLQLRPSRQVRAAKRRAESFRKVDLYAALLLAHEALYDYRTRGNKLRKRTGRSYFL